MDENMKAAGAVLFADAGRNGERFFHRFNNEVQKSSF